MLFYNLILDLHKFTETKRQKPNFKNINEQVKARQKKIGKKNTNIFSRETKQSFAH